MIVLELFPSSLLLLIFIWNLYFLLYVLSNCLIYLCVFNQHNLFWNFNYLLKVSSFYEVFNWILIFFSNSQFGNIVKHTSCKVCSECWKLGNSAKIFGWLPTRELISWKYSETTGAKMLLAGDIALYHARLYCV